MRNVYVFLKKVKFCNLETLKLISCGIISSQLISSGIELLKLRHLNLTQNAIDDAIPQLLQDSQLRYLNLSDNQL